MFTMLRLLHLILGASLASPGLGPQAGIDRQVDASAYLVSYVEVMSSSSARASAVAAFRRYRDESRKEGSMRFDLFEQIGRPGHFVVVEAWRDQAALDARASATQQQLVDALQPVRVSGYDQRPYKGLTVVGPRVPAGRGTISVVSHVDTAPAPTVPALLRQLASESRREPGNVRFDVLQHTMRANHFTVIETWQSQKALDAHVAAEHTKRYRDELQPVTGSPLDERVYILVD
jgi:quinol monooxygenase YgiN